MLSAKHILSAKHCEEVSVKILVNPIPREMRAARQTWPNLRPARLNELRSLLLRYKLSVVLGEVTQIEGRWYVTHSGLLQLAARRKCSGIRTLLQERLCDPTANRWVFRAVVYKGAGSIGFVGYGDADPSNVSPMVRGAEMRVAETRAVNRALRKAYGIGLCSVEELGSFAQPQGTSGPSQKLRNHANVVNDSTPPNGQPRLRDKLCLLIRKYELDPELVKRYAASFCGTEIIGDASRDLVASFIESLTKQAVTNPEALTCKLNGFRVVEEVKS
jgi:hypothetical protein